MTKQAKTMKSYFRMMKNAGMLAGGLLVIPLLLSCNGEDVWSLMSGGEKLSVSIPSTMGVETRAVELDGNSLNAVFNTSDKVCVFNYSTGYLDEGTLSPDANGAKANLTGTLTRKYSASDDLMLLYNYDTEKDAFCFTGQDGTFEGLQKYDCAAADVLVASVEGGKLKTGTARFKNLQSMLRLEFRTDDGLPVKVSKLTVHSEGDMLFKTISFRGESEKGDIEVNLPKLPSTVYVALSADPIAGSETYTFSVIKEDGKEESFQKTVELKQGFCYSSSVTLEGHEHVPVTKEVSEPSCTTDGIVQMVCDICGLVLQTNNIPAFGHSLSSFTNEPTCTEAGSLLYQCVTCGETVSTESIPALGHDVGEWVTTLPPTCTESGVASRFCLRCGETVGEESLPALGHDWGEWMTITPPTPTESGEEMHTCNRCGLSESKTIPSTSGAKKQMKTSPARAKR